MPLVGLCSLLILELLTGNIKASVSLVLYLNAFGSLAAICGVVMYNYLKVKDVRASQLPIDNLAERAAKVSIIAFQISFIS